MSSGSYSDDLEAGILNNIEKPRVPGAHYDPKRTNFFRNTEDTNSKKYDINILKSRGPSRAIVLRQENIGSGDDGFWSELGNEVKSYLGWGDEEEAPKFARVTCRIPEIHSACPVPSDHPDRSGAVINAFYHTFTSQTDAYQEENCPSPGEIVWCDYGDRENMASPQFIKPVNESKFSALEVDPSKKTDPKNDIKNNPPVEPKRTDPDGKKTTPRTSSNSGHRCSVRGGDHPDYVRPSFIKKCTDEDFKGHPNPTRCESKSYCDRAGGLPADSFVFHDTAGFTFGRMVASMGHKHINLGTGSGVTFAITEGNPQEKILNRFASRAVEVWSMGKKKKAEDSGSGKPSQKDLRTDPERPEVHNFRYGGAQIFQLHGLLRRTGHSGLGSRDPRSHGVEIVNRFHAKEAVPSKRELQSGKTPKTRALGQTGEVIDAKWQVGAGSADIRHKTLLPSHDQMESGYKLVKWLSELPVAHGGGLVLDWPMIQEYNGKKYYPYGTCLRSTFLPQGRTEHLPGVYAHGHLTNKRADGYTASIYAYLRIIKGYSPNEAYKAAKQMCSNARIIKNFPGMRGLRDIFWAEVL